MPDIYGTYADGTSYFTERGRIDEWADNETEANAALLIAAEYIDNRYRSMFPGLKTGNRAQLREWPRTGAYDVYADPIASDELPRELAWAAYEVAARQIASPGSLQTDAIMGEGLKQVSVDGAISVTFTGPSSIADMQLTIPIVDSILAPILTGADTLNTSPLVGRAVRS